VVKVCGEGEKGCAPGSKHVLEDRGGDHHRRLMKEGVHSGQPKEKDVRVERIRILLEETPMSLQLKRNEEGTE
jgi:hypothetical protein